MTFFPLSKLMILIKEMFIDCVFDGLSALVVGHTLSVPVQ